MFQWFPDAFDSETNKAWAYFLDMCWHNQHNESTKSPERLHEINCIQVILLLYWLLLTSQDLLVKGEYVYIYISFQRKEFCGTQRE